MVAECDLSGLDCRCVAATFVAVETFFYFFTLFCSLSSLFFHFLFLAPSWLHVHSACSFICPFVHSFSPPSFHDPKVTRKTRALCNQTMPSPANVRSVVCWTRCLIRWSAVRSVPPMPCSCPRSSSGAKRSLNTVKPRYFSGSSRHMRDQLTQEELALSKTLQADKKGSELLDKLGKSVSGMQRCDGGVNAWVSRTWYLHELVQRSRTVLDAVS